MRGLDSTAIICELPDPLFARRFFTLGTAPAPPAVVAAAAVRAAGVSAPMTMTAPEAFRRAVVERRARDGVWDGRSAPSAAVLAASARARTPARPVVLPIGRGTTTTPEKWRADLERRRREDRGTARVGTRAPVRTS